MLKIFHFSKSFPPDLNYQILSFAKANYFAVLKAYQLPWALTLSLISLLDQAIEELIKELRAIRKTTAHHAFMTDDIVGVNR